MQLAFWLQEFQSCKKIEIIKFRACSENVAKSNSLKPREPGISLSCSSRTGGLQLASSFPSGRTLKRHFSSRFQADSNNCPIRGMPEEMLIPIEPG